jgi:hypothetical protein
MNNAVETGQVGQFRVTVVQDEDARNPRENDNMGRFALYHRRYGLGDFKEVLGFRFSPHAYEGWEEFGESLIKDFKPVMIKPVSMYDHSGISLSFGVSKGWDSAQVGFAYITREALEQGYGKNTVEDWSQAQLVKTAESVLESELAAYNAYVSGDVYGFVVEEKKGCDHCGHSEWGEVESCWGFYSSDEAMTEGKTTAEAIIRRRAEKQAAQVQQ